MHKTVKAVLVPVLVAGSFMVGAGQASAATGQSATCDVVSSSCTTGVIRANGRGHFVDVGALTAIWRGANWYLWDYDIGRVVASGHINRNTDFSKRITGLYGQYALQITDSAWDTTGVIDNY